MAILVLIRHGQSEWNKADLFTGWTDVGLSAEGAQEARDAGRALGNEGIEIDVCHTSVLRRAIKTLWLVLEETGQEWLTVHRSWRLNERHYGALQGLNKQQMAETAGPEQVRVWRRSWDVRPPLLDTSDQRHPGRDRRYRSLDPAQLPCGESLKDTVERVLPYWHEAIEPDLRAGRNVLLTAHGNSLRGLVKHLDRIPEQDIPALEIPTGKALVYRFGAGLKVHERGYLSD